jgi:hypothetical protein
VDGADARTPTPEARHEPGESEIAEARRPASPTPPPRRGSLSWGMPPAVRIELLGRRTPEHSLPPIFLRRRGLMLTRGYYGPCLDVVGLGCPRWFAGLSTPPIHPSPPEVASGGYGRPGCRGSPPPATSNNQEQHSRAIGRRPDPRPSPAHGGSRMRGSSCITCGHHPRPPGRRLIRNGDPLPETIKTPAYKQGRDRGSGRGSGWGKRAQENIYKLILS